MEMGLVEGMESAAVSTVIQESCASSASMATLAK